MEEKTTTKEIATQTYEKINQDDGQLLELFYGHVIRWSMCFKICTEINALESLCDQRDDDKQKRLRLTLLPVNTWRYATVILSLHAG
jgi:hypothetical protein